MSLVFHHPRYGKSIDLPPIELPQSEMEFFPVRVRLIKRRKNHEKKSNPLHPQEKVAILRCHLLDQVPVSDLYEELQLAPNMLYRWQKEFFENGSAAFASKPGPGRLQAKAEIPVGRLVRWIGVPSSTFFNWKERYGLLNEHNAWVPRDHWVEPEEKAAVPAYAHEHPLEGYRRLAYMMMDAGVAALSPASVYRVLRAAQALRRGNREPSQKGTGFQQPQKAHEHWHIDVSYLNICGTFYYLCSVLDGYSRSIVHWEIRESMKEAEVELILQRAREKYPEAHPRIISDNGPQFLVQDFKEFIRLSGMTHVRTSPFYPQSNGKIERWHKSLKSECIRPKTPLSLEEARRVVTGFVEHYNTVRLHSAIGYVTPQDKLRGREQEIWARREQQLREARERRKERRQTATPLDGTVAL